MRLLYKFSRRYFVKKSLNGEVWICIESGPYEIYSGYVETIGM